MRQFVVFLLACVGCAVIGAAAMRASVEIAHAAGNPVGGVPACEAINHAGAITIYRCEPDWGAPYLINSIGFMKDED